MLLRYLLQQLLLYQQVDFTLLDLYDSTIILKLTFHFVVWLHFLVVVYMGPEGFLCAALGTCVSDNWKVVIGALLPASLGGSARRPRRSDATKTRRTIRLRCPPRSFLTEGVGGDQTGRHGRWGHGRRFGLEGPLPDGLLFRECRRVRLSFQAGLSIVALSYGRDFLLVSYGMLRSILFDNNNSVEISVLLRFLLQQLQLMSTTTVVLQDYRYRSIFLKLTFHFALNGCAFQRRFAGLGVPYFVMRLWDL